MSKKRKRGINAFIILFSVIVIATLATYVVTPGSFEREIINGKTVVIANSYHAIKRAPLSLLSIFQAIPNGLVGSSAIMFLIMLVGGCLEVYNRTGALDKGISRIILQADKWGSETILVIIMVTFALIGGFLGWCEQIIPFVPLVVSICLALGYDSVVGVAASAFVDLISFATSPTNVYTVGIAHSISGLPMFSGMQYRLVVLLIFNIISIFFILRYARKVKNDPTLSLVKDIDVSDLKKDYSQVEQEKMSMNQIFALIIFGVTFVVAIYGVSSLGWSLNDLSAAFVFSGIAAGAVCLMNPTEIVNSFMDGAKGSFNGAMVVGVARGIQYILQNGGLVDPLINAMSKPLIGLPLWATAIGAFIVVSILNGLIPSGSGKAMAFMPILIPLADLVGISRQTMVLAYQFGDGISNPAWFTFGTTLIFISLGKIPLKKWYRFILPIEIALGVAACVFLVIATKINYGPF